MDENDVDRIDCGINSDVFNIIDEYDDSNIGIFPQHVIEALFNSSFANFTSLEDSDVLKDQQSYDEKFLFDLPDQNLNHMFPAINFEVQSCMPSFETNEEMMHVDANDDYSLMDFVLDSQVAYELLNAPEITLEKQSKTIFSIENILEQAGGGFLFSNGPQKLQSVTVENETPFYSGQSGGVLLTMEPTIKESYIKKWNAMRREITFTIPNREMSNFFDANDTINNLFEQIFSNYIEPIDADRQVQYIIDHDTFDIPITSGYIMRNQITSSMIQNHFEDVFQSRKKQDANTFQDSNSLVLTLNILPNRQIRGGSNEPIKRVCKEKRHFQNMKDLIETSRFIHVVNSDNFCLVRAILIGKAFFDKEKYAFTLVRKNNRKLNTLVKEVVKYLKFPDEFLNLMHIKMIEEYFVDYRITVYDSVLNGSRMIYPRSWAESFRDKREKFIDLCCENEHYIVITKMTSFYNCTYFCQYCKVKYSNLNDHDCEHLCRSCKRYDYKCKVDNTKICPSCNLETRNETCKNLHDSGQCFMLKLCEKCNQLKSRNKPHVCENEKWCPNCKCSVALDHKCYIKQNDVKKFEQKFGGFIWFDIECFVNEENFHEADLIMAKRKCVDCLADRSNLCELCAEKYAFPNIEAFVNWCLIEKNQYFTFISHNGKSYDNYFIMRYLQRSKTVQDPHVDALVDGLKVLTFRFRTLTFKDSSLFIQNRLESFTKIFGIKELKKGFFPHDFHKRENFEYKGSFPDKKYYKSEYFEAQKKKSFDLWYETMKDREFDFAKELEEYCWSDVELLAEGCLRFGDINLKSSKKSLADPGIQPFMTNLTISSYCNTLYRRNFMPKDSIPWIPANGYNPNEKTSRKAEQWLRYLAECEGINIQHSKNGGEKKIGKYKVDGYCESEKRIYEFQGKIFGGFSFSFFNN